MGDRVRNGRGWGKSVAFVLPTPVPTWAAGLVSTGLTVLNRCRETEQVIAKQLSFISFLHWAVVKRAQFHVFDADRQAPNHLAHDYNLFLSTFDGPWDPYVEAFTDVLGHAIDFVWGFSVGYPGAVPEGAYKRYIVLNQVHAEHHYSAYPCASVLDVRRCLHLHDELEAFAAQATDLSGPHFQQAFHRLLLRVQNDLGSVGPIPVEADARSGTDG
jgi:hypothetical protein